MFYRTILIDCGKTFRERALSVFPKKGLRKIDACILTRRSPCPFAALLWYN